MKTMKKLLVSIAAACVLLPGALTAAPVVVGTTSLETHDRASGRKFTSELWFEAAPGSRPEDFSIRAPLRAIPIARNATPAPGWAKRPLVVVSHGNWGSRFSQGWLAMRLVRAGYVVLSTSHPGTLGDDQSAAGRLRMWDRSRDVSSAMTQVLNDAQWSKLIDPNRIGFAGHSFGGWTGVSLAGGRYDPAKQAAYCRAMSPKDFYCDGTLKDDTTGIATADGTGSFKDIRFKAFYIMATGPGQGFSDESLKSINVPFVVDTAAADEILEPRGNSSALAKRIAGAVEIVRPVGHFAYVPECKPLIGALLARAAGVPICDNPSGVERGRVHEQVAEEVIGFFSKQFGQAAH